jgi:hypothetical protein
LGSSSSTLQQLSLKGELIAELRSSKAALDAVIEAKDKLLVKQQEPSAQRPDTPASSSAETAASAERLAAAEARLLQLEAAGSAKGGESSNLAVSNCEPKRARRAPGLSLPLEKDEVLDEIFSFVGRKEWLYAGGVCRRWRGRYFSMCYKARASKTEPVYQTSHKSCFATAARFSLALETGLVLPDESEEGNFFDDLSLFSQQPIEVLTLARVHAAAWHSTTCSDAALYGDFELLKWLHKSRCPWVVLDVAICAIRSTQFRNELTLPWLFSTVKHWSQEDKNKLLVEAGIENDICAAELMLEQGAEWPSSFVGGRTELGESVRACWGYKAVAWALRKGCSWGEWRCQDLAPELYSSEDNRKRAANLFKWAHQHDCPCTCEASAAEGEAVVAA